MNALLRALRTRLDRQALPQLQAEVSRLATEVERLQEENLLLERLRGEAEERADWFWRDMIDMQLALCEERGGSPGLTKDGRLVVVAPEATR